MKFLVVLSLVVFSSASWACRPNLGAVRHSMAIETLDQARRAVRQSVLRLANISITDFDMYWVSSDPRIGCPDKYVAQFQLEYTGGLVFRAKATSYAGETQVEFE